MLHIESAADTVGVECSCGRRNEWCSGEMLRYHTEQRLRRKHSKLLLMLMHESVGSKQEEKPW